jgi:hypothetical protein
MNDAPMSHSDRRSWGTVPDDRSDKRSAVVPCCQDPLAHRAREGPDTEGADRCWVFRISQIYFCQVVNIPNTKSRGQGPPGNNPLLLTQGHELCTPPGSDHPCLANLRKRPKRHAAHCVNYSHTLPVHSLDCLRTVHHTTWFGRFLRL